MINRNKAIFMKLKKVEWLHFMVALQIIVAVFFPSPILAMTEHLEDGKRTQHTLMVRKWHEEVTRHC